MLIASFFRGPYDGRRIVLPTREPWPRFVIPEFGSIQIEHFYLYSGWHNDYALYLYDEDFSTVLGDH